MRLRTTKQETSSRCAHLGMADDPFSRGAHASDEHRCYAHMGRERIDLSHQKRFCLTSAHGGCPFLLVNQPEALELAQGLAREKVALVTREGRERAAEVAREGIVRARTWWRNVSPAGQGLTAAQPGRWAGLGVAATSKSPPAAVVEAEPVYAHRIPAEPVQAFAMRAPAEAVQEDVMPVETVEVEPKPEIFEETRPLDRAEEAREWFWRAKNAETLDELVKCLERAHALDPDNEMVAVNLEWARERREAQRQTKKAKKPQDTEQVQQAQRFYSQKRRNPLIGVARVMLNLVRTTAGLAVVTLGAAFLLVGTPAKLQQAMFASVGMTPPDLPDASALTSLVHVPLGGGYDLGMAFPYVLGFAGLFIGFGLLHREPSPGTRG